MFGRVQRIIGNTIKTSENNFSSMTNSDIIETCKAAAAQRVVEDNIKGNCIVGLGSGSTMTYVLRSIKELCKQNNYSIKFIPTSLQAKQLIHDYMMPLTELDCDPIIDIAIDGADEVDENFVAIKGGGACLTQEKVVAFAAKKFVVVADYRKDSKFLGQNWKKGIPIEVLPMACNAVRHYLSRKYDFKLVNIPVRIAKEKAGPVITDNGNLVLDWNFDTNLFGHYTSPDWKDLANEIKLLPGVIETGIFAGMIEEVYFGQPDGNVLKRTLKSTRNPIQSDS